MGKIKDKLLMLNGKKLPLTAILVAALGYGGLQAQVAHHKEAIVELRKYPTQITAIQTDVENIKGDVSEIKDEQRIIREDIKKILFKVTNG